VILALAVSAVPVAINAQTPITDKETDVIKEYLWKKGMSIAPTNMYLAARTVLKTEVCGQPSNDSMVNFYLRGAGVEAPASVITTWYELMKKTMKDTMTLHPEEARAFCSPTKTEGQKAPSTNPQVNLSPVQGLD
jgi:hypothetical protein